jgi:hypothetical protein
VDTSSRSPSVRTLTSPKAARLKAKNGLRARGSTTATPFSRTATPSLIRWDSGVIICSTWKNATSSVTKTSGSSSREHLPSAPISVARGWMNSLRALSSPDETTDTTGETACKNAPEKSADPWWGTLKTSACRFRSPRLCARVRSRSDSSLRSPLNRKEKPL